MLVTIKSGNYFDLTNAKLCHLLTAVLLNYKEGQLKTLLSTHEFTILIVYMLDSMHEKFLLKCNIFYSCPTWLKRLMLLNITLLMVI